jgi:hypothetical protein
MALPDDSWYTRFNQKNAQLELARYTALQKYGKLKNDLEANELLSSISKLKRAPHLKMIGRSKQKARIDFAKGFITLSSAKGGTRLSFYLRTDNRRKSWNPAVLLGRQEVGITLEDFQDTKKRLAVISKCAMYLHKKRTPVHPNDVSRAREMCKEASLVQKTYLEKKIQKHKADLARDVLSLIDQDLLQVEVSQARNFTRLRFIVLGVAPFAYWLAGREVYTEEGEYSLVRYPSLENQKLEIVFSTKGDILQNIKRSCEEMLCK